METCPKIFMTNFELKACNSEATDFTEKLLTYIYTHYQESPESYQKELIELVELRENAVKSSRDFLGLNLLKRYYRQLQFLSNRFPMKAGEPCEVFFSWDHLYNEKEIAFSDIRFEQLNILYNIGALHSYLGCLDKRMNDDGIKISCTHFQYAAWAFQTLRDQFTNLNMANDLNGDVLTFKFNLMLAQAQECVLEKSIIDQRKTSINAKISAQIIDYYKIALTNNEKSDFQDNVNSKRCKEWKQYILFKINYYTALSNYFSALNSIESKKFGESIGYLQVADVKLSECSKMKPPKELQDTLKFTCDLVDTKLKAAKKENDFVYNEKIVSADQLPEVKGVSLVKCLPIDFQNDPECACKDIFARLVSMKAHEISSLYSEEKAKLLRSLTGQVEDKNTQLEQFLQALQIDKLHLNNFDYLKLPKELLECCASVSIRPQLIKEEIPNMMKQTVDVSIQIKSTLEDIEELIESEEKEHREDKRLRGIGSPSSSSSELSSDEDESNTRNTSSRRHNNKHLSPRKLKLKEIINRYELLSKKYSDSNETSKQLHETFTRLKSDLEFLSLPISELSERLPKIEQTLNDAESKEIRDKLTLLLSKVDEMKVQREQLLTRLKRAIQDDDLTKAIASQQNEIQDFNQFFQEQMKKHEQLITYLQQNLSAQDNILRALADANAAFASDRIKILDATRTRTDFINRLINSFQTTNEFMEKAKRDVKIVQDLNQPLGKLLSDVKEFCIKCKQERSRTSFQTPANHPSAMMTMIQPNNVNSHQNMNPNFGLNSSTGQQPTTMSNQIQFNRPHSNYQVDKRANANLNTMNTTNDRPKLKDFLPFMKPERWGNQAINNKPTPPSATMPSNVPMPSTGLNNYNNGQFGTNGNPIATSQANYQQFTTSINQSNQMPAQTGPSPATTSSNGAFTNQPATPQMQQQSSAKTSDLVAFNPQSQFNPYTQNQQAQLAFNQANLQYQQQQQSLNEQKMLRELQEQQERQKQMEQQLKEKEFLLKKQIEQQEQALKLQQQQFMIQQQQQLRLMQQQQQIPLLPMQQSSIPTQLPSVATLPIQPTLQPNPTNQIQFVRPNSQVNENKAPAPTATPNESTKTDQLKKEFSLDSLTPDSVYKPGFFNQIKSMTSQLATSIQSTSQPGPVTGVVPTMRPANLTQPHMNQTPSHVLNSQVNPPFFYQQQPANNQSVNSYSNMIPNMNQSTIQPNFNSQLQQHQVLPQPTTQQKQPELNKKPNAIDDLLDIFGGQSLNGTNSNILTPVLQPQRLNTELNQK